MSLYIIKASGEKELFDIKKIASALRKAGASEGCIEELTQKILAAKNITSTADIYEYVAECLATHEPVAASRYNIKRGLMQLGRCSGFRVLGLGTYLTRLAPFVYTTTAVVCSPAPPAALQPCVLLSRKR